MSFIRENLKSTYNSSLKGTDVACCDNIGIVESFVPIFFVGYSKLRNLRMGRKIVAGKA